MSSSDSGYQSPTPIERYSDTAPISVTRCKAPTYSDYRQIVPSVQSVPRTCTHWTSSEHVASEVLLKYEVSSRTRMEHQQNTSEVLLKYEVSSGPEWDIIRIHWGLLKLLKKQRQTIFNHPKTSLHLKVIDYKVCQTRIQVLALIVLEWNKPIETLIVFVLKGSFGRTFATDWATFIFR